MKKPSGIERFKPAKDRSGVALGFREQTGVRIEGWVFTTMNYNDGRQEVRDLGKNVITNSASILLARLIKDNVEPANGAFALAVGLGAVGIDPNNPPPATAAQTQLANELTRKQFQSINFISGGVVSATPTNVIDLTTFFDESEAVGGLTEMGLVGGDATLTANTGTLINYRTFPIINKPPTATLTITWRLTF